MLLDKIKTSLKQAIIAKDEIRVSTLRFLLSEIHNRQIDKKVGFGDEDVIAAIKLQVKQHKESIELFKKGNRPDLADKEGKELTILNTYLPQQIAPDQLDKIVKEVIEQVKPTGPQDFGRLMGAVMAKVKGQADGNQVADLVNKILNSKH